MIIDESIIKGCIAGKRSAQNALYRKFSAMMLSVCMRYTQNRDEAEDILQEAFIKIFQNIATFRGEGSFEGWMKRIMINHALNHYRKNKKMPFHQDIDEINEQEILNKEEISGHHEVISADILLSLIQLLPHGYRMVFNLYVFEEYSHKEIGKELNISENTSKTQLLKARRMLRRKLSELNLIKNISLVHGR